MLFGLECCSDLIEDSQCTDGVPPSHWSGGLQNNSVKRLLGFLNVSFNTLNTFQRLTCKISINIKWWNTKIICLQVKRASMGFDIELSHKQEIIKDSNKPQETSIWIWKTNYINTFCIALGIYLSSHS